MKVGIFGDSYCCNNIYLIRDKPDHTFQKSWVDHLENEENIKVNSHARPGSNLHYSFTQFKKHYNEYDKIIFVVTNWGRIWVPNFNRPCIPGLAYCEHMLKIVLTRIVLFFRRHMIILCIWKTKLRK